MTQRIGKTQGLGSDQEDSLDSSEQGGLRKQLVREIKEVDFFAHGLVEVLHCLER